MIGDLRKTPWPWFGGKADAAPHVWDAMGDVDHYVEPFAGSLAVLLRRPHTANRTYHSETVNDLDGLLCNAWRAIARDPDAVADAASWPVCEADLMARHLALLAWRAAGNAERLMADPDFFDAKMAGWWMWGQSCWIGSGWCSGTGPWVVGADGRITKRPKNGGVHRKLPNIADDGRGVNQPRTREEGVGEPEYHPMTMPELRRWMRFLSARLRHVRICNGDWSRVTTTGALTPMDRRRESYAGVFLDPPYASDVRTADVYAHDSGDVASDVRAWCREHGTNPRFRIVLAGFDSEHAELESHEWVAVEWFRSGFLKGGMSKQSEKGTQQHRERLWLSPACIRPRVEAPRQRALFEAVDAG